MSSLSADKQSTRTGSEPLLANDSESIARRFETVRERTLSLVAGLDWETLSRQHTPILSPMIWDLGHVANFEEIWLGQQLGRRPPIERDFHKMFDAISNPRPTRDKLPLPAGSQLFGYMDRVRHQSWKVLKESRGTENRQLEADGFVYEMVAEHEEQHQETILQLLQMLEEPFYVPGQRRYLPAGMDQGPEMMLIPGGPCLMGWGGRGFAYDNEKERHEVDVPPYFIDRTPVTCSSFLSFVEEGGYSRRKLWSESGWAWRNELGAEVPANWQRNGSKWQIRSMDRTAPVLANKPVVHVSYYEAEAFARFVGKRLPTETEWEKAALWDPEAEQLQSFPWGEDPPTAERANVDQLAFGPADVGAYPQGVSAYGVHQMIGDVWEWTSSDFLPYPGFQPFPYPGYSAVFFGGDYKVLRGGSWATRPAVARGTFRNWDYPVRRQIFAGFRCARDA